jgi:type IV pilus assembly protein PilY1
MNDGTWVAAFGNGYNNTVDDDADGAANDSTTGNAVLYIVNLETGELIAKIDTLEGMDNDPLATSRPNGLSTPVFVDVDGDSDVDLAYAGDLFGNMWKFDLSNSDPDEWEVAYGGEPLFQAFNDGNNAQPITSRPNVARGPGGVGLVVLFGTGKYMETGDTTLANLSTASFYGLIDANTGANSDRIAARHLELTEQTIETESGGLRTTSNNPIEAGRKGWYMDLQVSTFQGEMQVTDSLIRNGRVVFTTLIPNTAACGWGGTSWLMEINLFTGARALTTPFDLNNNGLFDDTTNVNGTDTPVSGVQTTVGITPKPAPLSGEKCDYLIFPGTSGGTETRCRDPGPRGSGRQSWRQAH